MSSGSRGVNGNQNDNSAYASGAVAMFARQGSSWVQQVRMLKASNADQSDHFGASVALSRDGNTLAVAAPWESSAATGIDGDQNDNSLRQAGAVRPQSRGKHVDAAGAYQSLEHRKGRRRRVPGDGDQFGYSLALSGDGNTLAVGAISEDGAAQQVNGNEHDDSQQSAGAVYVFNRMGAAWTQQAHLKGSHQAGDMLGFAVALRLRRPHARDQRVRRTGLRTNASTVRATTPLGARARMPFARSDGAWKQQAYIKGSRTEATDQLGYVVAISDDGNTVAAGAGDEDCLTPGINPPGCDNDSPPRGAANIWVGAAHVFVRSGTTWTEQAFIKANNPRPYNSFVKLALERRRQHTRCDRAPRGQCGPGRPRTGTATLPHRRPSRSVARTAQSGGGIGCGAFHTRSGATWTQRAYVKGSNTEAGDESGSAVALSTDGRIMAIGAHNEDGSSKGIGGNQADNSADDSGVYALCTIMEPRGTKVTKNQLFPCPSRSSWSSWLTSSTTNYHYQRPTNQCLLISSCTTRPTPSALPSWKTYNRTKN